MLSDHSKKNDKPRQEHVLIHTQSHTLRTDENWLTACATQRDSDINAHNKHTNVQIYGYPLQLNKMLFRSACLLWVWVCVQWFIRFSIGTSQSTQSAQKHNLSGFCKQTNKKPSKKRHSLGHDCNPFIEIDTFSTIKTRGFAIHSDR